MKNRKLLSPILFAASFSLVGSSIASAQNTSSSTEEPAVTIVSPTAPAAAAPSTSAPAADATAPTPLPPHTANYTIVKGDTLTKLAERYNTTRKKLEALNNLADEKIAPGQVILVPSYKKKSVASAEVKNHPVAQPVQDFDIAATTSATSPVSKPEEKATSPDEYNHAPVAKLVSPADLDAEMKKQKRSAALTASVQHAATVTPVTQTAPTPAPEKPAPTTYANTSTFAARPMLNTSKMTIRSFGSSPAKEMSMSASDWSTRFIREARALGDQGLDYDDDWRPPGENRAWTMDCSNTTRYLYKITAGIELPRTASDQYYYLHLQGKAWDVPQGGSGFADSNYLRQNLKPGDLLFWENTYRPERQPPITHVMIFLGTNDKGQWIMAGSQCSRGGEHNRRNGGPDIYCFRPWEPCGGYTTWLGMVHHKGRFVAFGRPLEADRSKLATNN